MRDNLSCSPGWGCPWHHGPRDPPLLGAHPHPEALGPGHQPHMSGAQVTMERTVQLNVSHEYGGAAGSLRAVVSQTFNFFGSAANVSTSRYMLFGQMEDCWPKNWKAPMKCSDILVSSYKKRKDHCWSDHHKIHQSQAPGHSSTFNESNDHHHEILQCKIESQKIEQIQTRMTGIRMEKEKWNHTLMSSMRCQSLTE